MANVKENAARKALEFVSKKTKVVGLGTGSTANFFIKLLAQKAKEEKLKIECVATSVASEKLATGLGLKVIGLEGLGKRGIDLAVDGADFVDSKFNLIKGYGGALAREKVVDYAAKTFVVIADESKIVKELKGRVPIEVLPFAAPLVARSLDSVGVKSALREAAGTNDFFVTDNGNLVLDAVFESIPLPRDLEQDLKMMPGVVENGLFSHNVAAVIVGKEDGAEVLQRK